MEHHTFIKRRLRRGIFAAAVAVAMATTLVACTSAANQAMSGADMRSTAMSAPDIANAGGQAIDMTTEVMIDGQSASMNAAQQANRSIISSGSITIEVDEVQPQVAEVARIADDLGGYVEAQNVSGSRTHTFENAMVTIRVPSDSFDEAFAALSGMGTVLHEDRSATDVTAQHVDLQARVAALEASIDRLTELMAGAATTGELLEAEAALSNRQAELDGLRAQLESLEGQVDEATIWVSLTTTSALPGGPDNFWDGLLAGLNSLSVAGAGALVLLGVLLPWLAIAAIISLIVIALVRAAKRRKARRAATDQRPGPVGDPQPQPLAQAPEQPQPHSADPQAAPRPQD